MPGPWLQSAHYSESFNEHQFYDFMIDVEIL